MVPGRGSHVALVFPPCTPERVCANEPVSEVSVSRALVLNATFEPLCVVTSRRALLLVLADKAELVAPTGRLFHSPRASFPEPSVIRLSHFVRVPYPARVALNRRTVFARDGHRCQYCGADAENIDHVVPRSRGGAHAWDNVVAACRRCNSRKENHLLHEAGMHLRRSPTRPAGKVFLAAAGGPQTAWEPYLASTSLTA